MRSVMASLLLCALLSASDCEAQSASEDSERSPASTEAEDETDSGADERNPKTLKPASLGLLLGLLSEEEVAPRFSLGLGPFYASGRQTSLANSLSRTTVTVRDLSRGTTATTVNVVDPGLNNRKFDYRMDLDQAGIRAALTLPRLAGANVLLASVGVEVGEADVTLDFLDRNRRADSTSVTGNGPTYGVGFDVARCVTPVCAWTVSAGYWFRYLPSLTVDRAVPAAAKLEVLSDRATLERTSHEVSTRFAYGSGTGKRRWVPYTGVLYRHTEVEVQDALTVLDEGLGIETRFDTVSRFDSDAVLGIVGVEGQLSGALSGSLETYLGDGDQGVRFQVSWNKWGKEDPEWGKERDERKARKRAKQQRRSFEKWEKRFASLVPGLLARLAEIEEEYLAGWRSLEVVRGVDDSHTYRTSEVRLLLDDTRDELVDLLSSRKKRRDRDLAPLRDYVEDRRRRTLELLGRERSETTPESASAGHGGWSVVPALFDASRTVPTLAAQAESESGKPRLHPVLEFFQAVFPFLRTAITKEECRSVELRFRSGAVAPDRSSVLVISPFSSPEDTDRIYEGEWLPVPRGSYGFGIRERFDAEPWVDCNDSSRGTLPNDLCPLDLIERPCGLVRCHDLGSPTWDCRHGGKITLNSSCYEGTPKCPRFEADEVDE